ncbi:hypothetical protein [Croceibacterium mercuriale]|uniref:hypothetical protein n=1 Tax=Croceibacterium mercuriale TaxID=1572751 RepID=UPI000A8DA819|nr:hypothetical protein [Croceibacterium mercuriale]
MSVLSLRTSKPDYTLSPITDNPGRESDLVNRRNFLMGGTAFFVAACGGGDSGTTPKVPAGALPPAPSPVPTPNQVFGPEIVPVQQFYRAEHGDNVQPAFQAAINEAQGTGRKVVNDMSALAAQMWAPVRSRGFDEKTPDGVPLVIREPVHVDFRGLSIDLRGPGGGTRKQALAGSAEPWLGGWLYAFGHKTFDRLTIENVTVNGGFDGDYANNEHRNLSDKGFRLQDTDIKEIYMRNIELKNFAAEIYYIGGLGPLYQEIENCHFHGSPQAAWNPGGTGKLVAKNLQAGRAWQSAEVVCGQGHTYVDCRFYQSGHGGAAFLSGPSPVFTPGLPYWYTTWDGIGDPPYNYFRDTRFENHQHVRLGSWTKGDLALLDTGISLDHGNGRLEDIELRIKSISAKRRFDAVSISGPETAETQVRGCPEGIYYRIPSDINLEVVCEQTEDAVKTGVRHTSAVIFEGGLVDAGSIRIKASGSMEKAQNIRAPVVGFVAPLVQAS